MRKSTIKGQVTKGAHTWKVLEIVKVERELEEVYSGGPFKKMVPAEHITMHLKLKPGDSPDVAQFLFSQGYPSGPATAYVELYDSGNYILHVRGVQVSESITGLELEICGQAYYLNKESEQTLTELPEAAGLCFHVKYNDPMDSEAPLATFTSRGMAEAFISRIDGCGQLYVAEAPLNPLAEFMKQCFGYYECVYYASGKFKGLVSQEPKTYCFQETVRNLGTDGYSVYVWAPTVAIAEKRARNLLNKHLEEMEPDE